MGINVFVFSFLSLGPRSRWHGYAGGTDVYRILRFHNSGAFSDDITLTLFKLVLELSDPTPGDAILRFQMVQPCMERIE